MSSQIGLQGLRGCECERGGPQRNGGSQSQREGETEPETARYKDRARCTAQVL